MADSFAKMVSIGLQYGVPIETIVTQLKHMRYQPMGYTGDSDIPNASSITDFIAQWFRKLFLDLEVKAVKLPFDNTQPPNEKTESGTILKSDSLEQENNNHTTLNDGSRGIFKEELGFSGETCPECGSASMIQNGKCLKCVNCGATTGCS
jgi:ribonucleoside-diphosphate reductase alpha chain